MEATTIQKQELYYPLMSEIIQVDHLTRTEKRFIISLPDGQSLGHKPGQFVELSVFGFGEAPISISSSPTKTGQFDLTIRATGRLTDKMHHLKTGNLVGIRGPFGNGFDVSLLKGKDMLFVCGGIGLAPLKSLIDYTLARRSDFGRIIIVYGTKNPSEILYPSEIKVWQERPDVEFHMTVDRPDVNWEGKVGVITTLIPPLDLVVERTVAAVVGPPVMYKFVLMALKAKRLPDENIYMSLERRMKCGVGKCGHCQINHTYVCQDGPVFHYPDIKRLEEAI